MQTLLLRYRQAPLYKRTLLSVGASALLTLGFLGSIALGIDAASSGLRSGGDAPSANEEETLASEPRAGEAERSAGPVSRSAPGRRAGSSPSSKVLAQNGRADEGRRGPADRGGVDEE